ncbi:hypothetical protein [Tunturiibacter gelidiferens]|uniref:hypothetical protein n=1 Tax=Tunturiibacter gelidiferens TaxID=3069689 RepID=UPI003D9BEA0E
MGYACGRLLDVAMARVEVEDVDGAKRGGFWADAARVDRGGVPVLVLEVDFDGEVMGEVVVQADAGERTRVLVLRYRTLPKM